MVFSRCLYPDFTRAKGAVLYGTISKPTLLGLVLTREPFDASHLELLSMLFGCTTESSVRLLYERVVVNVPNKNNPIYLVFAKPYTQTGILLVIDV